KQAEDGPGDIVDQPGTRPPGSGSDVPRVDSPVREPALAGGHAAESAGRIGDDAAVGGTSAGDNGLGTSRTDHHAGPSSHEVSGSAGDHGDAVQAQHSEADGLADGEHPPGGVDADGNDLALSHGDDVLHMSGDDALHPGGEDAHLMGNGRAYEARVAPESTIPVPPEQLGDIVLDSGDHVYFREGSTAVGYDRNTIANFDRVKPMDGYHDVVVHGNRQGYFEPGRRNEAGVDFPAPHTHPTHIAEAIRNNPTYDGGPVRLISCHSGTIATDAAGRPLGIPAAQAVANELGVPVKAPTDKVGTDRFLGPGQEPKIFNDGYWRTFLPML
ncbi:hypothetical protein ACFY06_38805, partial [Streptomyces sp. NPDC001388]